MREAIRDVFGSVMGQELEKRLWLPEQEPKAVIQLVHGMAEYIDRYDETAKAFASAGFAVVGHTHLGHGERAERLGYFAPEGGWDALIEDAHAVRLQMQQEYPALPYFMLGHSMGSFVVRTYCLQYEKGLSGVLLSGTGHFSPAIVTLAGGIAALQCALGMEQKPGRLLDALSSSGYNNDFADVRTRFDWLSANEKTVDAYVADPLCGFTFTVGAYRDLFEGLKRLYPVHLSAMEKEIPVYLFAGDRDPVGQNGKGVRQTADELRAAGVRDVTVRLYQDGRHEMFNEIEREKVWAEVIEWIEHVLGKNTLRE